MSKSVAVPVDTTRAARLIDDVQLILREQASILGVVNNLCFLAVDGHVVIDKTFEGLAVITGKIEEALERAGTHVSELSHEVTRIAGGVQ
jgi:hypothetical protein